MKKTMLAAAAALIVATSVQAQSTVDSIAAKYKLLPMPGARTLEQTFPVLGNYQLENSTETTGTVTVNLDSSNKGIVWVDGLPQGKIKAYLRKSPSTYRVLSQKTSSGRQIQEGTMHYDTTSHQLHIALGKAYNETDPTAVFDLNSENTDAAASAADDETASAGTKAKTKTKSSASKSKAKVQYYTASKVMPDNMMMNDTQTQQQSDSTSQQQ